MKKINLSELFTANNYIAPQFSPEKKAQIFANTTREKRSFRLIKKKYFVEVALSLVLVFVIGINLDYIQNIGKPLEIDYQNILDADLGVAKIDDLIEKLVDVEGVNEDASSASIAVLGENEKNIVEYIDVQKEDVENIDVEEKIILKPVEIVEVQKEDVENIDVVVEEVEIDIEKQTLWDKWFRNNETTTEDIAYEIVPERQKITDKLVIEEILIKETVTKNIVTEAKAPEEEVEKFAIEMFATEELVEKEVELVPIEPIEQKLEGGFDDILSLSFVDKQSISVLSNSAKLKFSLAVNGNQLLKKDEFDIVCNIFIAGNFVDTFSYRHIVSYDVNNGDVYSFVDDLLSSYALYVLGSYNADDFDHNNSGIKCGIPKYNIASVWIDLAYED